MNSDLGLISKRISISKFVNLKLDSLCNNAIKLKSKSETTLRTSNNKVFIIQSFQFRVDSIAKKKKYTDAIKEIKFEIFKLLISFIYY